MSNKWARDMDLVRSKEVRDKIAKQGVSYLPGQMDLPGTEPTSKQWLHYRSDTMLRRAVEQKPCDIGLFSDEANQIDLIEMLMDPHE